MRQKARLLKIGLGIIMGLATFSATAHPPTHKHHVVKKKPHPVKKVTHPVKKHPKKLAHHTHKITHHQPSSHYAHHHTKHHHLAHHHHSMHHHLVHHHAHHVHQAPAMSFAPPPMPSTTPGTASLGYFATPGQRMIHLVYQTVQHLSSNQYRLGGTDFDFQHGIYRVDCSNYVDHLLSSAAPKAYANILANANTVRPTSQDYFSFFKHLHAGGMSQAWYRIPKVNLLNPGDILVFHYKNLAGRRAAGHVMVVVNKPQSSPTSANTFLVRVSDSAPSGHTGDTRPFHTSGIGIGTLLLKVDALGEPFAYAWKWDAPWKYNMDYAMARPLSGAIR